jgi:uncharacterized protein
LIRLRTPSLFAALLLFVTAGHGQTTAPATPAHYNYDASIPLNPILKELPDKTPSQTELRKRWHLTYSSTNGERVTAIFTLPQKASGPYPAVIMLAGSGGHKDVDYVRIASDMMSTLGYATLSIDAQYHGERSKPGKSGDIHLVGDPVMRDGWTQTVIDLRRAVDFLLSRRNIDATKIGYLGFSQGGMIGGTFIGVEPRIAAACLAIPGGGFYEEGKKRGLVTPENDAQFLANAKMTDPIYFLGQFSPRPLLVLSATKDELIPKSMTDALYNAAKEPKQIKWFNSGHVLPPSALLVDVKGFFAKHFGERKAAK